MSVPCSGACGLYVDEPGQWCVSCWPTNLASEVKRTKKRTDDGKEPDPLSIDLLRAALAKRS